MSTDLKSNDKIKQRDEIWLENEEFLRRICNQKLSSCPQEIDDVLHDTYIALCDAFDDGRVIRNHRKWLIGTLMHKINKKYTEINNNKKKLVSMTDCETRLSYTMDMDSVRVSDELTEEMANEIISSLSEKEQTLYHLIHDEHLKHKQIATMLGIRPGTVRERAYRLRHKITKIAENYTKDM